MRRVDQQFINALEQENALKALRMFERYRINTNVRNDRSETVLMMAAKKGYYFIVKELLDRNANAEDVDSNGKTALFMAVCFPEINKLLLQYGAKIDHQDHLGYTPLAYATLRGYEETVEVLLPKGANVLLKTNKGETALDIAIREKEIKIIAMLEIAHQQVELDAIAQQKHENEINTL